MTELLVDVEYIRPIAEKLRSEGVPEVVKPENPNPMLGTVFRGRSLTWVRRTKRLNGWRKPPRRADLWVISK
jgi:hypothetical protein